MKKKTDRNLTKIQRRPLDLRQNPGVDDPSDLMMVVMNEKGDMTFQINIGPDELALETTVRPAFNLDSLIRVREILRDNAAAGRSVHSKDELPFESLCSTTGKFPRDGWTWGGEIPLDRW